MSVYTGRAVQGWRHGRPHGPRVLHRRSSHAWHCLNRNSKIIKDFLMVPQLFLVHLETGNTKTCTMVMKKKTHLGPLFSLLCERPFYTFHEGAWGATTAAGT